MQLDAANFRYRHPRGILYGYITESGLRALQLPHPEKPLHPHLLHSAPNIVLGRALHFALDTYFAGHPEDFAAIPLDLTGATAFQTRVWQAARQIPWGTTIAYGQLARRLGLPATAGRAVGRALAVNPIHLLIPCHRILAANGHLTGFAAGLAWKQALLQQEGLTPTR